jgi:HNH endonuclease
MAVSTKNASASTFNPRPGLKGEQNNMWKGGKSIASNGYVLIRVGVEHPLADCRGYAYEHRVIASDKLGRLISSSEQVHHIDGNKTNNHPDNLEVLTVQQHRYEHRKLSSNRRKPKQRNPIVFCACGCGEKFRKFDQGGRPRKYISGHNSEIKITPEFILHFLGEGYSTTKEIAAHFRVSVSTVQKIATSMQKLKILFKFKGNFYCASKFQEKYKFQNPAIYCACGCGQALLKFDRYKRSRQFISGHNGRR